MKVKRIALVAAILCILSVLFYMGVMVFSVSYDLQLSLYYNYFDSARFKLVLIMLIFSVVTSVLVLRTAAKTRGFGHALVFEAIYLVFLVLSFEKIYHGIFSLLRLNGYAHSTAIDMFFLIIIFIPCVLSMIFEAFACVKAKSQTKSDKSQNKEEHI